MEVGNSLDDKDWCREEKGRREETFPACEPRKITLADSKVARAAAKSQTNSGRRCGRCVDAGEKWARVPARKKFTVRSRDWEVHPYLPRD